MFNQALVFVLLSLNAIFFRTAMLSSLDKMNQQLTVWVDFMVLKLAELVRFEKCRHFIISGKND